MSEGSAPSSAPPARPGGVVRVVAVLVAAALTCHIALTVLHVTGSPLRGPVGDVVTAHFDRHFRQNWNLFAPTLNTEERVLHVRGWVADAGGGESATPWVALGATPDVSTPLSNVDYRRSRTLVANTFRHFEDAEWALRDHVGDPTADPSVLAARPGTPATLVQQYSDSAARMARLAAARVESTDDRPVLAVQVDQQLLTVPPFDQRTEPASVTYRRELPWWGVEP